MHRTVYAALAAATLLLLTAGSALAARPAIAKIDFSQFEPFAEADWAAACGFSVDVEFEGQLVVHEFGSGRLIEIDTWRTFQSYSANGITFVAAHPVAGPDLIWTAKDGTTYHAIAGRSPADGLVGRLVLDDGTDELISIHGREIDNPYDDVCALLTP